MSLRLNEDKNEHKTMKTLNATSKRIKLHKVKICVYCKGPCYEEHNCEGHIIAKCYECDKAEKDCTCMN